MGINGVVDDNDTKCQCGSPAHGPNRARDCLGQKGFQDERPPILNPDSVESLDTVQRPKVEGFLSKV